MQRPFGRTQTGRCHIVLEKETVIFNALQFEIYLFDCRREAVAAMLIERTHEKTPFHDSRPFLG